MPWRPVWAVLFLDAAHRMRATYRDPVTMPTLNQPQPLASLERRERERETKRWKGGTEWDGGREKRTMATFVSWRSQPCCSSSASLNSYIVTELFVYVGAPSDASPHQSVCSLVSFCLRNVRRKKNKNKTASQVQDDDF